MAIESPKYEVLFKAEEFEVRQYSPYIVAETTVDGDFESASTVGFKRLAGYIFGGNISKQKISMTAPVGMEKKSSEKIAMTAPVGQEKRGDKYVITFSMPSSYTLETLPTPNDRNVEIRSVPERTYASIQFSGTWSASRYQDHLNQLTGWMKQKNFDPIGEPNFSRYDPPWTLWFLRRNEILIEIKRPEEL